MIANLDKPPQIPVPDNVKTYVEEIIDQKLAAFVHDTDPDFETFSNEDGYGLFRKEFGENGGSKDDRLDLAVAEIRNDLAEHYARKADRGASAHAIIPPTADLVNKQYVDAVFERALSKDRDVNMNHYKISNVQHPTDHNDAATKHYVDQIFKANRQPSNCIFSSGRIDSDNKTTVFFSPGFVVPYTARVVSVGISTSSERLKPIEKMKACSASVNPLKLYFVVDGEVQSEHVVTKEFCEGYALKEFPPPAKRIVFEKGVNLTMMTTAVLEDAAVTVTFCHNTV